MKTKLAIVVLASTVALSSTAASARDRIDHHHYRNAYNSVNIPQGRPYGPAYDAPSEYSSRTDSSLSGTGPSTFGGAGDSGGAGGGGP